MLQTKDRLISLDIIRGLAAFFIMLYHFNVWESEKNEFQSYLYLIGRHGVSTFYVLSGFTLHYVYSTKFHRLSDSFEYFVKRIFRIYPLLLASQALTLMGFLLLKGDIDLDLYNFILNVSGLFGIFDIELAYATGSWSIGNEIFFYIIFPFCIIYVFNKNKRIYRYILFLSAIAIFHYFSFFKLNPSENLSDQWRIYANSLNQFPLFIFGMFLSYLHLIKELVLKLLLKSLFIFILLILIFIPELPNNSVGIVHGYWRTYFTICICLLVYVAVLKTNGSNHNWLTIFQPFIFLGEISYSVYLLHPIVYNSAKILSISTILSKEFSILICSILTILFSSISYLYFEKRFIALAKKFYTVT